MVAQIETPLIELTVGGEELTVESAHGTLAVSRLFCITAQVPAPASTELSLHTLNGAEFVLTINSALGDVLCVRGLVAACVPHQDGDTEGYTLDLVPKAHLRRSRRNHRVFQDASVRTIVTDLLTKSGADVGAMEWKTNGTYPVRPYVVQSGESDWDFVERLLADEGIYYYFRFDEKDTVLVFADQSKGAPEIPGASDIPVRDANQMREEAAIVHAHHRMSVSTDRVRLRDYDPKQPTAKLDETVSLGSSWREYYDAPGRFTEPGEGSRRARIIAEALRAQHNRLSAHTSVLRMQPGHQFTMLDHPIGGYNGPYFVEALSLAARQSTAQAARHSRRKRKRDRGLQLHLAAIPLDVPYRHFLRAPAMALGPQTGFNVGPSGEEIHTDDQGHARTQFYWDREGKKNHTASTWMRVGQFPLAGSMMLPRMHWDQLVGFTAGDVDAPVVLGHLYDSVAKVPYALPANKTRTSWQTATTPANGTANEIRYEDKAGSEEMFLNASYDMTYDVGKDSSVTVGVDQSTDIGVNQTWSVGSNQSVKIQGAQEVSIGATETLTVSGARSTMIGGNDTESIGVARTVTVSGGATLDADGGRTLTAGAMMMTAASMGVERMTLGQASITVGGAWIGAAGTGIEAVTAGASTELVGGAKIQAAGKGISTSVKGKASQVVGGALISAAGGNAGETSGAALDLQIGGALVLAGPKVLIEAKKKLVIKVGGTTLTMTTSKIHIKSPSLASPGATISKTGSTVEHNS